MRSCLPLRVGVTFRPVSLRRITKRRSAGARVDSTFVARPLLCLMNAQLLAGASKVIPLTELLVNVVSRRVRQLSQGHRPLITAAPGMGAADVALTEIIEGKLTSAPAENPEAVTIAFPATVVSRKKAA